MHTRYLLKINTFLLGTVMLFAFTGNRPEPVNFSGTWLLNEGKSELGQFGARSVGKQMVILQQPESTSFTITATDMSGAEITNTEVMSHDGKASESSAYGLGKKISTLKWADDGKTFTVTSQIVLERNGQSFEFSTIQVWSLDTDGKTLSLQTDLSMPQGEIRTKAVYDKQ